MYRVPDPIVLRWLDQQFRHEVWTNSVSIMEIRFGIEVLPSSKRKQGLLADLDTFLRAIGGRVAAFDADAAEKTSELMAQRRRRGRTVDFRDSMIAGIAVANGASIATRNVSHFADLPVPVLDPWKL